MEVASQPLETFNRKWTAFEATIGELRQLLPGTIMELHLARSSKLPADFRRKLQEADRVWREIMEFAGTAE